MYVACGELLLGADDGSAALCGVQGAFAFDCRFSCCYAGPADFAADLGDVLPVVGHCGGGSGGREDGLVSRVVRVEIGVEGDAVREMESRDCLVGKENNVYKRWSCAPHKHGDSCGDVIATWAALKGLAYSLHWLHVSMEFDENP